MELFILTGILFAAFLAYGAYAISGFIDKLRAKTAVVGPNGTTTYYCSAVKPEIVQDIHGWFFRFTKWQGLDTFWTFTFSPTGTPKPGQVKRCFQVYNGVKVDGSVSLNLLRENNPTPWVYIYAPKEQSAFRIIKISGDSSVFNMAGQ